MIPVHNLSRPIDRAVASLLENNFRGLRVSVICHNVSASLIATKLGDLRVDRRVRIQELLTHERTPAAPRNFAIRQSTADYLGFLDSDDEYERGAIDGWIEELEDGPDILIGQLTAESSGRIQAPLPRRGRFERLDAVKDFLNYRTAPLGVLIHRTLLNAKEFPGYRPGLRTGEDIAAGLYLWNYAEKIHYSRSPLGYLVREGGLDRVTSEELSPQELFAPVLDAISLPPIAMLRPRQRQAIAVKLLRTQVFGQLYAKRRANLLEASLLVHAAAAIDELARFARGALGFIERRELRMIEMIRSHDPSRLQTFLDVEASSAWANIFPTNPFRVFAPESPIIREIRSDYWRDFFRVSPDS